MVTHLNVAVDDELAARAKAVKESRGWTWEQFIDAAAEEFDHDGGE